MGNFQKYRDRKTNETIEAKKTINEFGETEYCIYRESAGDNFWGEDWPEDVFLANFEEVKDE